MELQVQELLKRIKDEGVDEARAEAERIVAEADLKAKAIVVKAEKSAFELEAGAATRIEAMEKASKLALVQASRDTILALREKVQGFMRDAIVATSAEVLDAAFIEKVLPDLLKSMVKETQGDLVILLPPATLKSLASAFANRLAKELGKGVQFKPFDGIDAGFRIAVEASSVQYDFSAESVAEILASRVNARLAECVKASLAEDRLS
ncbi:MAG TPA: V-type ATP synthase subunit E [Rectinemataceae bacterium]|nr:V-type ATP synthase subunit E [Rectinemataceae bacterium]